MRFLFLVLFLACSIILHATDIAFVVYHSKGANTKAGSKSRLKKGDQLLLKDILTLGEESQLVLVCSNYKVIQISKKGNYPIKKLLLQCKKTAASYSSSYFKYIWEQFTHPHGSPDKNPEDYMKNVGAVSRGCHEVTTSVKTDTVRFHSGYFPVYWDAAYEVSFAVVYNQLYDGAPMKKIQLVKGKPFLLGDLLKGLSTGDYYWQVEGSNGGNCERKYLQLWDKQTYRKAVAALLREIPATTKAEEAFASAFVLEENYFIAEALGFYQQAVKLQPSNPIYKKSLEKFHEKQL